MDLKREKDREMLPFYFFPLHSGLHNVRCFVTQFPTTWWSKSSETRIQISGSSIKHFPFHLLVIVTVKSLLETRGCTGCREEVTIECLALNKVYHAVTGSEYPGEMTARVKILTSWKENRKKSFKGKNVAVISSQSPKDAFAVSELIFTHRQ